MTTKKAIKYLKSIGVYEKVTNMGKILYSNSELDWFYVASAELEKIHRKNKFQCQQ